MNTFYSPFLKEEFLKLYQSYFIKPFTIHTGRDINLADPYILQVGEYEYVYPTIKERSHDLMLLVHLLGKSETLSIFNYI